MPPQHRDVLLLPKSFEREAEQLVLWRHFCKKHGGVAQLFNMDVTGVFRNDAMLREITESVRISHVKEDELIITKAEWNYLPFPGAIMTRMWIEF